MIDEESGQWTLSLAMEGQKKISSLLGLQIIRSRQEKEDEEAARLLYVAMTRARDSLSLVWQENPRQGTWASDFPFELSEGNHEKLGFKYQVRRKLAEPSIGAHCIQEYGVYPPPYREKSIQESRATPVKVPPEGIRQFLENSRRGKELYRFLESLRYQPELWNDGAGEYAEELSFLKSLNEIPFEKILSRGETDWHYVIEVNDQRLRGQVDLWVREDNQVWLLQYKVGALKDADKTLEGLENSAWAMKQMGLIKDSDQIHLWVIYTSEKETRSKAFSAVKLFEPLNVTT